MGIAPELWKIHLNRIRMERTTGSSHGPVISKQAPSRTTRKSLWTITAFIVALLTIGVGFCFVVNCSSNSWVSYSQESLFPADHDKEAARSDQVAVVVNETDCTCEEKVRATSVSNTTFAEMMGLHGTISDCCCSFQDLEKANEDIIYPLLQRIVATPFFAHFKIDLYSDCELWDDQPVCMLRDCSVCEVAEPPFWAAMLDDCESEYSDDYNVEDRVVTTVDWKVSKDWLSPPASFLDMEETSHSTAPTASVDFDGTATISTAEDRAIVVDLRMNPERYTGYAGASAAQVWSAIHNDNCFQGGNDQGNQSYCSLPPEQRVYNRVISGMHSSISLHIAHSYCLQMDPQRIGECIHWGMNAPLAQERVLLHRDRLENLYVAFALLLRAVQKAGNAISTAVPHNDPFYVGSLLEWTEHLWPELSRIAHSCPTAFDEATLLTGNNDSKEELMRRFRYLQQIMQCVGCDRCKLWGTLQTLGVGTALRIILDAEDEPVSLFRQEAVALVHTLERFSSALVFAADFAAEV